MKQVVSAIERLASSFNGLGLWRCEQSVWGRRMRASTFDRNLYLWMHRLGLMGAAEREVLGYLVRPGMVVLDVGANMGLYSLLRGNCAANGATNVESHHLALGRRPERMLLHRPALNSGDTHLGSAGAAGFRPPVEVDVASLDSLMPGLRPDFIKVDVQGWELEVLRGMEGTLRAAENVGVFLEICPKWLRRAGESPEEIYRFVRGLGFRFFSCSDWAEMDEASFLSLAARMTGEAHVDLLAARRAPQAVVPAG